MGIRHGQGTHIVIIRRHLHAATWEHGDKKKPAEKVPAVSLFVFCNLTARSQQF